MKKLIISLLAAAMMAAGLVGLSSTSATAAQCDRYGVCVKPTPDVPRGPIAGTPGKGPKQKLKLVVPGDAVPEGTYRMIIKRIGGPRVFNKTKPLNKKGAATIAGPILPAGEYRVIMRFIPKKGTPWERVDTIRRLVIG